MNALPPEESRPAGDEAGAPQDRPRFRRLTIIRPGELPEPAAVLQSNTRVCPLLGLRDDPHSRALFPREDHVCFANGMTTPSPAWQQRYCIGAGYRDCPYYDAPPPAGRAAPPRSWWRRLIRRTRTVSVMLLVATLAAVTAVMHAVGVLPAWLPG